MIEIGAARLAATRRTDEDLAELEETLDEMRTAARDGDTEQFVQADIAFHEVVMRASGNAFVPLLFEPFGRLLVEGRRQTSAVPQIRTNAVRHHGTVLEALRAGDPEKARLAMDDHMAQTSDDLRTHVIDKQV